MIQNVLHHIGGVDIYGIISICLFFAFFLGMLVWVLRLKKSHLDSLSALPLDEENNRQRILEKCRDSKNRHE